MLQINDTDDSAQIRRSLNLSSNPDTAELRAFKEKEIYHQQLLDWASEIDTAELSNMTVEEETSYGKEENHYDTLSNQNNNS